MEYTEQELLTKTTDQLRDIFEAAFNKHFSTTIYRLNPTVVYRGRPNRDKKSNKEIPLFLHVDELWAPPQNEDLPQGRCNEKGQSLFYCTNKAAAILWELKCNPGDKLTIGIFENKDEFCPLGVIGAKKIAEIDDSHKNIFGNHYQNITPEGMILHNMVEKFFTSNDTKYYNITNAITSIFLRDNMPPSGFSPKLILPETIMGLLYPSVTVKFPAYNFVLKSNYSQQILNPPREFHPKIRNSPEIPQKRGEKIRNSLKHLPVLTINPN